MRPKVSNCLSEKFPETGAADVALCSPSKRSDSVASFSAGSSVTFFGNDSITLARNS